jgi:hypothetical protein
MMQGGVLWIDRAYFALTGGRERWLYRVARKHAGGAGEVGFAIAMLTLSEKSGAEGAISPLRDRRDRRAQRAAGLCARLRNARLARVSHRCECNAAAMSGAW